MIAIEPVIVLMMTRAISRVLHSNTFEMAEFALVALLQIVVQLAFFRFA